MAQRLGCTVDGRAIGTRLTELHPQICLPIQGICPFVSTLMNVPTIPRFVLKTASTQTEVTLARAIQVIT